MKKSVFCLLSLIIVVVLSGDGIASEKGSMMEDKGSTITKEDTKSLIPLGTVGPNTKDDAKESKPKGSSKKPSDSSDWGISHSAWAQLSGTADGSTVSGRIDLVETGGGLQVIAAFSGVTPGKHGFHIHAEGSCEDGGKAAGGHFNPGKTDHGLLPRDGDDKAHSGDMGNVTIDENGKGAYAVFLPGLSITKGAKNVNGKAIILHEKEDNFGQPTGNAGGRIGCGITQLNH